MNNYRNALIATAAAVFTMASAHAAPTYMPSGPQSGVAISTVTSGGWTQCYQGTMGATIGNAGEVVLNVCQGDFLMMAGRVTGSETLLSLAATTRADAIIDTGNSTGSYHLSNGSNWWYSDFWSWGFAGANETPYNYQCGSANAGMCLHTFSFTGGYSINRITGLNGSRNYEKLFFVADKGNDVPEPGSLALASLALLGAAAVRRRSVG